MFPMSPLPAFVCVICLLGWMPVAAQAPPAVAPASFASRIAGLTRIDGFMPLYWDARGDGC